MSRNQLFNQTKFLAAELGRDVQEISSRWRAPNSTTRYWRSQVALLRREIRLRDTTYNRAARFARLNRIAMDRPALLSGTDANTWGSELRRMRSRARRDPTSLENMERRAEMQAAVVQAARARQRTATSTEI